jgi:catechol 2,3-dioxygenase-like lactoylglutathione lyase family enzyme
MILKHVALCATTEENADKFYRDLLGLSKTAPKMLSPSLSVAIFNINTEMTVINYQNETIRFEIFIVDSLDSKENQVNHTCIEVGDKEAFINRSRDTGVMIRRVPREGKIVTFISDFDGNLFEIT